MFELVSTLLLLLLSCSDVHANGRFVVSCSQGGELTYKSRRVAQTFSGSDLERIEKSTDSQCFGAINFPVPDHYDMIKRLHENVFRNLPYVSEINFDRNRLSTDQLAGRNLFSGTSELREISFENNFINTLQGDFGFPKGLDRLILRQNMINKIDPEFFSFMPGLRKLDLSRNGEFMRDLQPGAFKYLAALTELNLGSNHFPTIPKGFFAGLSSLKILNLERSKNLMRFENGALDGLDLKKLNLQNSQFVVLERNAFGNSTIQKIDVQNGKLEAIQKGAFEQISGLTTLNLRATRLTAVLPGAFDDFDIPPFFSLIIPTINCCDAQGLQELLTRAVGLNITVNSNSSFYSCLDMSQTEHRVGFDQDPANGLQCCDLRTTHYVEEENVCQACEPQPHCMIFSENCITQGPPVTQCQRCAHGYVLDNELCQECPEGTHYWSSIDEQGGVCVKNIVKHQNQGFFFETCLNIYYVFVTASANAISNTFWVFMLVIVGLIIKRKRSRMAVSTSTTTQEAIGIDDIELTEMSSSAELGLDDTSSTESDTNSDGETESDDDSENDTGTLLRH